MVVGYIGLHCCNFWVGGLHRVFVVVTFGVGATSGLRCCNFWGGGLHQVFVVVTFGVGATLVSVVVPFVVVGYPGLHCCTRAFSGCSELGCSSLWCTGFSCSAGHRLQVTQAQESCCMDLVALQHVRSSRTSDRTHVPCIDRRILTHWPAFFNAFSRFSFI